MRAQDIVDSLLHKKECNLFREKNNLDCVADSRVNLLSRGDTCGLALAAHEHLLVDEDDDRTAPNDVCC